jgi:hypothetical protein
MAERGLPPCLAIPLVVWPGGQVELEPEVADWLEKLDYQRWAQALFHLDLLEERGALLGEPYSRQLSGKLRELRFYCAGERIRIRYWIAPGRRIIALAVFAKTRMHESAEISRAARAWPAASKKATCPMKTRRRDRREQLSAPAHHPGPGTGGQDGSPSGSGGV